MRASKLDAYAAEIAASVDDESISESDLARKLGVARSTLQNWKANNLSPAAPDWAADELSEEPQDDYTEIPVIYRDYSDQDKHFVYPLGDVHKGSPAHAKDRWQEWVTYLADTDGTSMLCTGDLFNAALKNSVSESYDEQLTVMEAREELTEELTPLAEQDKIDLLMPGNHEDRIYRAVGDCPVGVIASHFGVNYVREAAVVVYKVGDVTYTGFIRHGTGGGQVGARANRLAKMSDVVVCDFYVSGHTHSQLLFPQDRFQVNPRLLRVERMRQMFISSASFQQYDGYPRRSGFAPQKIGAPRIRLDGTRKDIHASC